MTAGDPAPASSAPLAGMRVLDLSQLLPGPYCTLLLAALGATVTKVEPVYGDPARHLDPPMFALANRGKTSVRLDLKSTAGQAALLDLAAESDVFVEGFRPGVTARLGCDFATLSALNPALVYCSLSGFGQDGPLAGQPTHDLSLQALAGAIGPSTEVTTIGVPWVDLGVATTAALQIVAHWRSGQAIHLDLALLDVARAWATVKPSAPVRLEPTYGTFTSSDGVVFTLALLEDDMWRRLCTALHLDVWSAELGLGGYAARVALAEQVRARVAAELGRCTAAELAALAAAHDLPLDRVLTPVEADSHEQVEWRRRASRQDAVVPLGSGAGVPLAPLRESEPVVDAGGGPVA
jgi:crotonobetainyl-CoA:carnitine CoA-transferase CaiB-like acyl-CoA transferase